MLVIGLTGNIGSGKSTVARRLASLGAKLIDADRAARQVVMPGAPALDEIIESFGPGILNHKGELDRKKMGELVFTDPKAREKLNKITHPRIIEAIRLEIATIKNAPRPHESYGNVRVAVIDAPLLIETGLHHDADEIWVVKVNEAVQTERLAERDGLTPAEVQRRIAAQIPQEEKLKYARRVIDNSGTPRQTIKQVDKHWSEMLKEHFRETGNI